MKRMAAIILIALMVVAMTGCGGSSDSSSETSNSAGSGVPRVSDDEAKTGFMVSFVSVFSASMGLAIGQEMEGASLDPETEVLTLESFDLAQFAEESESDVLGYTAVSGTAGPDGDDLVVDVSMVGGPVETIQYRMTAEQLQNPDGFSISVVANGQEMDLTLTAEDLQGEQ
jgi:hypothetical protein